MTLTGKVLFEKADNLSVSDLRKSIANRLKLPIENITDEHIVEALLLEEPSIEDCAVFLRKTTSGTLERIAYVVLSEYFSEERLQSYLRNLLPQDLLPTVHVPVSHLPLTVDGKVDELALAQMAVLDVNLGQFLEKKFRTVDGIDSVVVVVQEATAKPPLLHLSQLLPDWKSTPAISPDTVEIGTIEPTEVDELVLSQVPALSSGGSLPKEPEAPNTLPKVLQWAAQTFLGESIVYLQPDGSVQQQTYAGLLEEAERILAGLRQQGLKPQDKVIFQLELNQHIISAFWGCILGGFIPVIMSPPPSYQEANSGVEKLCNVWRLLDNPLILTSAHLASAAQHLSQWIPGDELKICAIETLRENQPDSQHHPCQPGDIAFFNLTSGSTGMPKCISLTHWNLISRAKGTNILCQHSESDIILNWLPFDHIGSISDWHVRCVYLGCQLIYASKEYILGRPLNWMDLLNQYRITHSWAPNFAYALVNDALKQEAEHPWDLSCVKSLLTAGEAVSSKAVEEFIDNLAAYGFRKTAVRPAFGMAEMGSGITYYQPTEEQPLLRHIVDKASLKGAIRRVGSDHPNCSIFTDLGPVIPGVSIRIVDAQNNLLMEDTIGFLQVKGDPVSPGYYKNPAVNQEVFGADGWFNTGDLGFISNGHLVVTGRAKETIIINGANYYNHEIEAAVEEIEAIEVSYTAACAVREPGAATEKLAIFFNTSLTDDDRLTDLLKQIRQTVVAKVGLNPDYLIPVEQSVIPKTAIGKIQRSQLSKQFEAGEFDPILQHVDLLLGNANTLPDWFYRQVWRPKAITPRLGQERSGSTLIFLDSQGVGDRLGNELRRQGQSCIEVTMGTEFVPGAGDRYQIDPTNPDHYHQLLSHIAATPQPIHQIIHLWNYGTPGAEIGEAITLPTIETTLNQGIFSVLHLIQALEKAQGDEQPVRLLVVADHSQTTDSTEWGMPAKAPVLGFLKSASQELPWLVCSHLDLPGSDRAGDSLVIVQELQAGSIEKEIAYRDGQRLVPRLEAVDWQQAPKQKLPFIQGGMYVISGGLGGVGTEIARYLLEHYQAHLLLLGRTPLPDPQTWDGYLANHQDKTAQRIESYRLLTHLGGKVRYEAIDISDLSQLQSVVAQASTDWQCTLNGIIHLAGNAPDRSILEETPTTLAEALQPKVQGTWALHQLVKDQPDSLFISFSSVNRFFGGNRAGAYAAANNFLDAFAAYQRSQTAIDSYCFAWSMWDEVGMSQGFQMKEFSRIQGYYSISPQQGMQSLLGCLGHGQTQLFIGLDRSKPNVQRCLEGVTMPLQTLGIYFTPLSPEKFPESLENQAIQDRFGTSVNYGFQMLPEMPLTAEGKIDREQLALLNRRSTTEATQPKTELEQQLVHLWQEVLGVSRVGTNESFFELGGSSLQAARLFTKIEEVFGKNLPLSTLFSAQTIEQLAQLLQIETDGTSWSPLVPIQPKGSKAPLFCMHGAGGNVLMYRELVPYLDADRPLYGLQAVGLDGGAPITRLQEMATLYLDHMRQVQPKGPYFLLGLSVGGLIAVEIAEILRAQGEEVAILVLIDSLGPGYPKLLPVIPRLVNLLPYAAYYNVQRLPSFLKKVTRRKAPSPTPGMEAERPQAQGSNGQETSPAPKAMEGSGSAPKRQTSWQNRLEKLSLTMIKYTPWSFIVPRFYLATGNSLPESFRKVQEATVKAFLEYDPEPYAGDVILFRATQQPPGCYPDPTLGWQQIVTGELTIYDVPGIHGESLVYKEKSIQALGKQLTLCLEKAQRKA